MLALLPLIIPLILFPISITAGTFGGQVINLDAKQFKKVMASEHASVSGRSFLCGSIKLCDDHWRMTDSTDQMVAFYAPW